MVVLQGADNIPQVRPTRTVRHEQKRYSLTEFDVINSGLLPGVPSGTQKEPDHDDDMRVCPHCKQSFHRHKLHLHIEKCDNRK